MDEPVLNLGQMQVEHFLLALGEEEFPTPASGSAAGMTAAIGAGLLAMSCRICLKKNPRSVHLRKTLDEALKIRQDCLRLANEDMHVFTRVLSAMKHRRSRPEPYGEAIREATGTLMSIVRQCRRLLEYTVWIVEHCSRTMYEDLGTVAHLAEAAAMAAALGARGNARMVPDPGYEEAVRHELEEHLGSIRQDLARVQTLFHHDEAPRSDRKEGDQ